MITIDQQTLNDLDLSFAEFSQLVMKQAGTSIKGIALNIVARAQNLIKDNGSIATGMLRRSGSVRPQRDGTIDAGFYAEYAQAVEYGRKSGSRPPIEQIAQWVRKKRIAVEEKDILSIAFAVCKSIEKNGTKGKPFLSPAYKHYEDKVIGILQKCISDTSEKYKGKGVK
jgi:hypothetical protein